MTTELFTASESESSSLQKGGLGLDINIVVHDSLQGNSMIFQVNMIKWIKAGYPKLEVIAGNVVTRKRVGMGCGSIHITPEVVAIGRPGNRRLRRADAVMMGGLLGKRVKAYRGMGSLEAIEQGRSGLASAATDGAVLKGAVKWKGKTHENAAMARYFSKVSAVETAQRVPGEVQDTDSVKHFLRYLYARLQYSFHDISVKNMQVFVHAGQVRFELRTASGQVEGGIHGSHSYTKSLFA
ncbi:hypothetical protein FOMPIDRAFT_129140 [Fomitopsis schrenkii]|uniref:IMP dehydrogenase/GMP reductase domain-containing protein n=1 Tax=Fomitopsis schrenkii TaxID=2126942 RepID=S8E4W3_FOMSC|nr:hypothetical protein FOMPIDRAFT_129140 [Fomitopsis schrenkii]